ncbi:cyclophilin-like domain-containing protein [Lipomyces kononenkoae]|uniref:Cyclophilin-like domain-containing protein n=1 Tax=Lipomyces kononenkoae TaxID=34357 RepID=A0ACC3STJ1_LIPKO
MPSPRVYMDISSPDITGRIIIELFAKNVPKTCENFRCLCTGERGPQLCYKGSVFHRVIADTDYVVQGGDITNGDGTGGVSIYGETFEDENIDWHLIDARGLVCMANRGPDTNSSQFFITLAACPELDGKHVVFGRVIPECMHVLDMFAHVETDPENDDRPLPDHEPRIVQCGELVFKKKKAIEERDTILSQEKLDRQSEVRGDEPMQRSRKPHNRYNDEKDYLNDGEQQRHSHRSPSESRGGNRNRRRDGTSPTAESASRSRSPPKGPQSVPKNPLMRAHEGNRGYKDYLDRSTYGGKGRERAYGRTHGNNYDKRNKGQYFIAHEQHYNRYFDDLSRNERRPEEYEESSHSRVKYKGRGTMKFIE